MRKPDFCICENKAKDQLGSNCTADQRLCFCYMDSTIPLLKSEISSLKPSPVAAQAGLYRFLSETLKTRFRGSYCLTKVKQNKSHMMRLWQVLSSIFITKTCPCNNQRFFKL